MSDMDLGPWRARIDQLDKELLERLNERMHCALEIGRIKKEHGRPIRDPEREKALLAKLRQYNEGPMRDVAIEEIFRRIIAEAVHLEEEED
jgi:chorismate mutase